MIQWKRPNPIVRSASNVYGPGYYSFTRSLDGQDDWIIYPSARCSDAGWTRQVRAQQFTWNADSIANLREPANRDLSIRLTAREQVRDRYEAEDARRLNNPCAVPDPTASNNIKVGYVDYLESTVQCTVPCAKAETYMIVIWNGNGIAGDALASHWLTINNENQTEISVVYSGWDMWGTSMIRATLAQGANTINFRKETNSVEID